jgi:hypothetical protein
MKIAGKHFLDSQTLAKALYALGMIKSGQGNSFVIDFPAVATAEELKTFQAGSGAGGILV